jgi:hypothetical protein
LETSIDVSPGQEKTALNAILQEKTALPAGWSRKQYYNIINI